MVGFIAPCLPTKTDKLPSGGEWLHEIKHDGFRVIARKKGAQVKLYSRPGNDLTYRFPFVVETLVRLRSPSSSRKRSGVSDKFPSRSCGYSSPGCPRRRSRSRPMNAPIAKTTNRKARPRSR